MGGEVKQKRIGHESLSRLFHVFTIYQALSTPARHCFAICLRHSISRTEVKQFASSPPQMQKSPIGDLHLWRWRESSPRPNLAMKASLRRVVGVIFKTGCEERRRNHSCPIPCLDKLGGKRAVDSSDYSAHSSGCRNPRG